MPICPYCGKDVDKTENEHVFPACLYPESKRKSQVQRLTIKACRQCNDSWSNDEAHFRNVLAMSGEDPNDPSLELWKGPINRSFDQPDGKKRIDDLLAIIRPVDTGEGVRQFIYPAEDERVIRVVKKIIRGLAHHHQFFDYVPEERVWADINRYNVPSILLDVLPYHHREKDIAEYWFDHVKEDGIHSAWFIQFFNSSTYVGFIRE